MVTSKKDERPKLKSSHGASPPAKKAAAAKKNTSAVLSARAREAAEGRVPVRAGEAPARERVASNDPSESMATPAARELATAVALAALDKKALGLEILDVAGRVDYADFLVLMSGRSDRHTASLARGIEDALSKQGHHPLSVEGLAHANWVLMDYGDVVVHVFQDGVRHTYDLEGLWRDADRMPLPEESRD